MLPAFSFQGRVGRESEGHLLRDDNMKLSHTARALISSLGIKSIQTELGSAQYEVNFPALELRGRALSDWLEFERVQVKALAAGAADARPIQIAVAPTLESKDLTRAALAEGQRWDLLELAWRKAFEAQRQVKGQLPSLFGYTPESIAVSSAMSSSQLHVELPVDEREAARVYNACVLASGATMALSVAAPLFLGRETGMADIRSALWETLDDLGRGRVFLGKGWISTPFEVLEQYIQMPRLDLRQQGLQNPQAELRQHTGSLWPHLRLIVADDHWRVENRVFSAEVSIDSIATAAFYFGLVKGITSEPQYQNFERGFEFDQASRNLQLASSRGLQADLHWPGTDKSGKTLLLEELIPLARRGLLVSGVDISDIERFLGIVEKRVKLERTTADWLILASRKAGEGRVENPMAAVAARYLAGQESGEPVCDWPEWQE